MLLYFSDLIFVLLLHWFLFVTLGSKQSVSEIHGATLWAYYVHRVKNICEHGVTYGAILKVSCLLWDFML